MLVALITDVHANIAALEAVFQAAQREKPDLFLFGGDLAVNGPRPRECLDFIKASGIASIRGNKDDAVLRGADPAAKWARDGLEEDGLAFLESLPLQHRLTPPGRQSPENDLLFVHATPRSNSDLLILEISPNTTSFTKVTPPEEALKLLAGASANLIVYGHIHYFSNGRIGNQRLSSIGSAGLPLDGDPRAAYALARWDRDQWQIGTRRVSYDYEAVAVEVENSKQPHAERSAGMIRKARWLA